MRTIISQMNVIPGDIKTNLATMLKGIQDAKDNGVDLIIFPEVCISGYVLGDRFEYDEFITYIQNANEKVREASGDIAVVFGSIKADFEKIGEDGRTRKYNAAFVAQNGEWVSNGTLAGFVPKTNLAKYRMFDDARHFYPAIKLAHEYNISINKLLKPFVITLRDGKKVSLGITICEDLWEDDYNIKPSQIYAEHGSDVIINISHSPFSEGKRNAREKMLVKRALETKLPVLYIASVGLENNGKNLIVFDGGSTFVNPKGVVLWRAEDHVSKNTLLNPFEKYVGESFIPKESVNEVSDAIIFAIRHFAHPFKKVVIGLSGGIDSAVSAAYHVAALGPDRVLGINMPTQYNSETTKDLARELAHNLGIDYRVIPIEKLVTLKREMLLNEGYTNVGENPKEASLVDENIQARVRQSVLADVAAAEGGVYSCNGNKTEVALNYFTLDGDGRGYAAYFGDRWKGQVYDLANLFNEEYGGKIPQGIIDIVPSAELSSDQNVDEGKGDPIHYEYHDRLLEKLFERRFGLEWVLQEMLDGTLEETLGCESGTIEKLFPENNTFIENLEWVWHGLHTAYKRAQLPPTLILSRRAFGFDHRESIMVPAQLTKEYEVLKERLLESSKNLAE